MNKLGLFAWALQRLGLRYHPLRVIGEQRRHLQRHETVHRAGARTDRRKRISRAAKIQYGEVEERTLARIAAINLSADFRVVAGTVLDSVVEVRGVGGQAGDRQLVDVARQRAAIEQGRGDVVEPQALAEPLVDPPGDDKAFWHHRYRSITNLERHLHANGTQVVKFFLHLSKEEQRKRFLSRIDEPDKNWKFSAADIKERGFWQEYMEAYEACLGATSTSDAPWYVVPADDRENARLIVSQIVLDTFEDLKMSYPKVSAERKRELLSIRKLLST
jgi:Polyphosphate kinase 2 (PPK2)